MKESTLYYLIAVGWLISAPAQCILGEWLYAVLNIIVGGVFLILAKLSEDE